jgi:hypothetical protein
VRSKRHITAWSVRTDSSGKSGRDLPRSRSFRLGEAGYERPARKRSSSRRAWASPSAFRYSSR